MANYRRWDSALCQVCREPIIQTPAGNWIHHSIYEAHDHRPVIAKEVAPDARTESERVR